MCFYELPCALKPFSPSTGICWSLRGFADRGVCVAGIWEDYYIDVVHGVGLMHGEAPPPAFNRAARALANGAR
eukprot:600910-Pyramimonas_sp.AAC.1